MANRKAAEAIDPITGVRREKFQGEAGGSDTETRAKDQIETVEFKG